MIFTGFADEAADDIKGQINALKELGWTHLESRNIDGVNLHDLPQEKFEHVAHALKENGIQIYCIGSTIANWSKNIQKPYKDSIEECKRSICRMKDLGTKYIRIMSFGIIKGLSPDKQLFKTRVKRLREITRLFLDEGLMPLHENCENYGGMGWKFTLNLLNEVPEMKLIFDTANPATMADGMNKEFPKSRQSSWSFYSHIKQHIEHIHIKDAIFIRENPNSIFDDSQYCWPGEGNADLMRILEDLIANNYNKAFSIEPHMNTIYHDKSLKDSNQNCKRHADFVSYGKRLMDMVNQIKQKRASQKCNNHIN